MSAEQRRQALQYAIEWSANFPDITHGEVVEAAMEFERYLFGTGLRGPDGADLGRDWAAHFPTPDYKALGYHYLAEHDLLGRPSYTPLVDWALVEQVAARAVTEQPEQPRVSVKPFSVMPDSSIVYDLTDDPDVDTVQVDVLPSGRLRERLRAMNGNSVRMSHYPDPYPDLSRPSHGVSYGSPYDVGPYGGMVGNQHHPYGGPG